MARRKKAAGEPPSSPPPLPPHSAFPFVTVHPVEREYWRASYLIRDWFERRAAEALAADDYPLFISLAQVAAMYAVAVAVEGVDAELGAH